MSAREGFSVVGSLPLWTFEGGGDQLPHGQATDRARPKTADEDGVERAEPRAGATRKEGQRVTHVLTSLPSFALGQCLLAFVVLIVGSIGI